VSFVALSAGALIREIGLETGLIFRRQRRLLARTRALVGIPLEAENCLEGTSRGFSLAGPVRILRQVLRPGMAAGSNAQHRDRRN